MNRRLVILRRAVRGESLSKGKGQDDSEFMEICEEFVSDGWFRGVVLPDEQGGPAHYFHKGVTQAGRDGLEHLESKTIQGRVCSCAGKVFWTLMGAAVASVIACLLK